MAFPVRRWPVPIAALLLTLCTFAAQAETYRMDLIVFLDRYAASEAGKPNAVPDVAGAIALDNTAALQAAGIHVLPDEAFGLQTEWQRLRNSRRYQPLIRLAWTQRDPPESGGPALRLRWGDAHANGLAPVDGRVALLIVNRYLTLDADLLYSSDASGWRLDTRRRMRRDELHHLDSARLGILARVTRADAP